MKLELYESYNKLFVTKILKNIKFDENIRIDETLLFVFQYILSIN